MKNSAVKSLIWFVVVGLIAMATYWYIEHKKLYPSTEDAYVQANTVQVAAQINGQIKQIFTQNHAHVKQLDTLLEVDPTPYKIAYDRALANLQNIQEEIQAGMSSIDAAKAIVRQQETALELSKKNLERTLRLAKKKINTQANVDKNRAEYQSAKDALTAAVSKLQEAKQKVGADDQTNAKLRVAKAELATTKWNLDNTIIHAPTSGIISNFSSRKGDTVATGNPLFNIVEDDHYWISANFKETSMQTIHVGQPVNIIIDMYPNTILHGVVESISPSSGASMALLPPENASGNWVKVTQRFPVHITITDTDALHHPLLIGASAKVTIDTTEAKVTTKTNA